GDGDDHRHERWRGDRRGGDGEPDRDERGADDGRLADGDGCGRGHGGVGETDGLPSYEWLRRVRCGYVGELDVHDELGAGQPDGGPGGDRQLHGGDGGRDDAGGDGDDHRHERWRGDRRGGDGEPDRYERGADDGPHADGDGCGRGRGGVRGADGHGGHEWLRRVRCGYVGELDVHDELGAGQPDGGPGGDRQLHGGDGGRDDAGGDGDDHRHERWRGDRR